MSSEIGFERVSPVIPVRNLEAALDRYRRLGFSIEAYGDGTEYGFADRGQVALHVVQWDQHDPERTGAHIYVYVSDADALRAEWMAAGVEGRFTDAQDTGYGLREFAYVDPDGTLHRVGSPLNKP
jgi:catechol 2,3-dioxygenase-like lactoylglutathione lyase family enzyme